MKTNSSFNVKSLGDLLEQSTAVQWAIFHKSEKIIFWRERKWRHAMQPSL